VYHYITININITANFIKSNPIHKICKIENREIRQTKSGLNIKEMIDIVLDEFGCADHKNYFVIDSARNMITACDDKEIHSCSGHYLNLALKHTFNNDRPFLDPIMINADAQFQ
jgi:hypothetical protein